MGACRRHKEGKTRAADGLVIQGDRHEIGTSLLRDERHGVRAIVLVLDIGFKLIRPIHLKVGDRADHARGLDEMRCM